MDLNQRDSSQKGAKGKGDIFDLLFINYKKTPMSPATLETTLEEAEEELENFPPEDPYQNLHPNTVGRMLYEASEGRLSETFTDLWGYGISFSSAQERDDFIATFVRLGVDLEPERQEELYKAVVHCQRGMGATAAIKLIVPFLTREKDLPGCWSLFLWDSPGPRQIRWYLETIQHYPEHASFEHKDYQKLRTVPGALKALRDMTQAYPNCIQEMELLIQICVRRFPQVIREWGLFFKDLRQRHQSIPRGFITDILCVEKFSHWEFRRRSGVVRPMQYMPLFEAALEAGEGLEKYAGKIGKIIRQLWSCVPEETIYKEKTEYENLLPNSATLRGMTKFVRQELHTPANVDACFNALKIQDDTYGGVISEYLISWFLRVGKTKQLTRYLRAVERLELVSDETGKDQQEQIQSDVYAVAEYNQEACETLMKLRRRENSTLYPKAEVESAVESFTYRIPIADHPIYGKARKQIARVVGANWNKFRALHLRRIQAIQCEALSIYHRERIEQICQSSEMLHKTLGAEIDEAKLEQAMGNPNFSIAIEMLRAVSNKMSRYTELPGYYDHNYRFREDSTESMHGEGETQVQLSRADEVWAKKLICDCIEHNCQLDVALYHLTIPENKKWLDERLSPQAQEHWFRANPESYDMQPSNPNSVTGNRLNYLLSQFFEQYDAYAQTTTQRTENLIEQATKALKIWKRVQAQPHPGTAVQVADMKIQIEGIQRILEPDEEEIPSRVVTKITIERETNPLNVLMMGYYFADSCIHPRRVNAYASFANALEANKAVLWIRDQDGEIIGRVLIGINDKGELVRYETFVIEELDIGQFEEEVQDYLIDLYHYLGLKDGSHESENPTTLFMEDWYDDGLVDLIRDSDV